jgi:hypothetical protein
MKTQLPQSGPLTHEQVAEEVGLGYTDPDHTMYRWRSTAKFEQWCDALYRRIPGSDAKVVIDAAVQVSPDYFGRSDHLVITID